MINTHLEVASHRKYLEKTIDDCKLLENNIHLESKKQDY